MTQTEFSYTVALEKLSNEPRLIELQAERAALDAIAGRLKLHGLASLGGALELWLDGDPENPDTVVSVGGRMSAKGDQVCVVSLEPIPFEIDTQVSGILVSANAEEAIRDDFTLEDDNIDVLGEIRDGVVDLGEVLVQQLALELDPFPRKPGVEPAPGAADGEGGGGGRESPFAALAKLKDSLK